MTYYCTRSTRMSFFTIARLFFSRLLWHLHVCIVITKTPSCLHVITITPIIISETPYVASIILLPRSDSYPVLYAQPKSHILIDSPWPFFTSSNNQCIWCTLNMAVFLHVSSALTVVIIPTVSPSNWLRSSTLFTCRYCWRKSQHYSTQLLVCSTVVEKNPTTGHTVEVSQYPPIH